MIDRLVHHAEVLTQASRSYRPTPAANSSPRSPRQL